MTRTAFRRALPVLGMAALLLMSPEVGPGAYASPAHLAGNARLYTPPPNAGAVTHIAELARAGRTRDAALLATMVGTPQAVWFTGGTPAQVKAEVRNTVRAAARRDTVPVLVAYNLPFRDCSQYNAGGALNRADYLAWIDAFASGIGHHRAIVLLEPNGLGLIPFYTDLWGVQEWCRPADDAGNPQPGASPAERFAALNGAVDRIGRQPGARLYLDATHSDWLGTEEATDRLLKAGLKRARGFFLNVSNFQPTPHELKFGTWISNCLAFAENPEDGGWRLGQHKLCASQYNPADHTDFSTWWKTDEWYAQNMGGAVPTTPFVLDTSRNALGPNWMRAYAGPPYHQPPDVVNLLAEGNWCNPPGRGLGLRPTTNTRVPLLDAYLWVKNPGESDGACAITGAHGRGTSPPTTRGRCRPSGSRRSIHCGG
ncbi:glycoside hydrolase family 6 protein [Phytohabitans rumicis]|uniref:Glucanase n=1 Tax=Phytohabitans rumicis TaxID=1076125 RepID=A0A6V8LLX2_9ACTN|nr:glycoside hydrolase family 6 protein [Phytohabitans rumicis]GFJ96540.1 glucanase [Phytohabitans rumicis]